MAGLRQFQRRAIEHVIKPVTPAPTISLAPKHKYFLNGREIFLLGISTGVGTCSDLHGINVAVFGNRPNDFSLSASERLHAAVLRRSRRDTEFDGDIDEKLLANCLAIEGLAIKYDDFGCRQLTFQSSGKVKLYVNLV